jgi:Protein of unknown function (DUF3619)
MKKEKILLDHDVDAAGNALRPHLDRAAQAVAPAIATRLAKAREAAVAKVTALEAKRQTASEVMVNGNTLAMSGGGWRERISDWRFWATGLAAAGLLAVYAGNEYRETINAREAADVELMILGDDVPVDALLDKGFKSFLREENN